MASWRAEVTGCLRTPVVRAIVSEPLGTVAQYVPSVALSIRQTVSVALFRSIVARVLLLRRMPFPRRSAIRPALCIIFEAELRQMQRAEIGRASCRERVCKYV